MRRKLIAGNWKMNGTRQLAVRMLEALEGYFTSASAEVVICPPFTLLQTVQELTEETPVSLGAQNVHPKPNGAYTGEVSAAMLLEFGLEWCIVGHSERRAQCAENDTLIQQKVATLLQHAIRPIICVGETLEQREAGEHEGMVIQQLRQGLVGLPADELQRYVIAYEPVWAIGTGRTASPEQANTMHELIRRHLGKLASPSVATEARIIYGGSVNAANASELLQQPDIDGALVGGASLKTNEFPSIVAAAG